MQNVCPNSASTDHISKIIFSFNPRTHEGRDRAKEKSLLKSSMQFFDRW
jgi:hypothetical protein